MAGQLLLASSAGRVRLIALFETLKGMLALALALGFGVMASFDENLQEAAQELVLGLHLDPSRRLPDAFLEVINSVHRGQIWIVVMSAVAYSSIRFSEAYGLWNERRWAAWVFALSGGVFLPIKAYELSNGLSWFRVTAALANVAIVPYMVVLLWQSRRSSTSVAPEPRYGVNA